MTASNSKIWPKIIRDPLHNTISFENTPYDRLLLELISTREFQRLRRIKQLGMSELVFPGAVHTRFSHSIGVMHTAKLFLKRLDRISEKPLTDDEKIVVLVAALIHDIGHGPFSHTFEKVTGEDHEARTLEIIRDESTEINGVLKGFSSSIDLPLEVGSFFATGSGKSKSPSRKS